jgi:Fe-S-cluster-containing dehydrogenase component/CRP-like cAMP-binding protein
MGMNMETHDERNRRWDEPFGDEPLDREAVNQILKLPPFAELREDDFRQLPLHGIIANDGRLQRYRRGEVIIREGDYGNSLFAILEGSVVGCHHGPIWDGVQRNRKSWLRSFAQLMTPAHPPEYRAARRRGGRRGKARPAPESPHDALAPIDLDALKARVTTFSLEAPQMFGELAALTRSPRIATIYAASDNTELFELRWQGLREIRNWSAPFRERIDALYRERGLVTRLQECPVFAHLNWAALDEIARESTFETFGAVEWMHRFKRTIGGEAGPEHVIEQEALICEEGQPVDGLLLINRGFARVTEHVDHGERTIGHLSSNDLFALDEIAECGADAVLRAGLHAIGYVDVIRIPTLMVVKHVLPALPDRARRKDAHTRENRGQEKLRQGMMDFLVDHRFINGDHAMVINLNRCVGCDDCVRACASAHDNNPRFTRQGYSYENAMVANACMHCTDAVCLIGCPTGAIHREEESGTIVIDDNTCIGCATCANSCPYENIKMVQIRDKTGALRLDVNGDVIIRATKCDLCTTQLTGPACVQACPHDALARINIRDTKSLLAWLG